MDDDDWFTHKKSYFQEVLEMNGLSQFLSISGIFCRTSSSLICPILKGVAWGVFRTPWNIWNGAFCKNVDGPKPLTVFSKRSILDVCQGSENATALMRHC